MKPIVYSRPGCSWCTVLMNWLDDNDIAYEVKDISTDMQARQDLAYRSRGVPTTVIGEDIVIGFNEERLRQLLQL